MRGGMLALLVALLLVGSTADAATTTQTLHAYLREYTGPAGGASAVDVVEDSLGNVWLCNYIEVFKYAPDGTLLGTFSGDGIVSPAGLSRGPGSHIFVANYSGANVLELSQSGAIVRTIGKEQIPGLRWPEGVAYHKGLNRVGIADYAGMAYLYDLTTDSLIASWPGHTIHGAAFLGEDFYVTSLGCQALQKAVIGGGLSTLICGLYYPTTIAPSDDGDWWIAEPYKNAATLKHYGDDPPLAVVGGGVSASPEAPNWPYGVYQAPSGDLYVADFGNARALRYRVWIGQVQTIDGLEDPWDVLPLGTHTVVAELGKSRVVCFDASGAEVWTLDERVFPSGLVSVDANHFVVVGADGWRLYQYDTPATKPTLKLSWNRWGSTGGGMNRPTGGTYANGLLYIADSHTNRVQVFSLQPSVPSATWLRYFTGSETDAMRYPTGLALSEGVIWIADTLSHRVQWRTPDGALVALAGEEGAGAGDFSAPRGMEVDAAGNVWVADSGNDRVQCFASDGTILQSFGERGAGPGQFSGPVAVRVSGNRLFVADRGNKRVQIIDLPDQKAHGRGRGHGAHWEW